MSLFGDYLKQLRESREKSLSDAARLMGLSPQKLWDVENGKRYHSKVPAKFIEKVSQVYRVPESLIRETTQVLVVSNKPTTEKLAGMIPVIQSALKTAVALANEAREYTPELEQAANTLVDQLSTLKKLADSAYGQLYSNYPKKGRKA